MMFLWYAVVRVGVFWEFGLRPIDLPSLPKKLLAMEIHHSLLVTAQAYILLMLEKIQSRLNYYLKHSLSVKHGGGMQMVNLSHILTMKNLSHSL